MRMPTILKILLGNKKAAFGLFIVVSFVLMALFAPLLASNEPTKRVSRPHQPPSAEYVMGTTRMGHDIWSQFANGARISLMVGFGAGILVCALAITIGITAGYFGGVIDECLTFLMNVVLVIPNLPLLLVLASFIGEASPTVIALIIGFTSWAYGARVIRAQTLALREKEFVIAAEVLGEPAWRIILVEILPNLISIIGVSFIGSIIYAIVTEATVVSWGIMLYNAQTSSAILVGAWWEILAPCFAIATLGAGLALLNFAIDEIANPQLRSHKGLNRWKKLAAPVAAPQERTA
ncbi:Dipeptide transport system permease protein DppC [Aeromonas salmonicida]|uniref:ABC transporter permease n=1 Tax=Aeromonas salmonicida TaxID=645 RepID=UPI00111BAB1F|nr:ABC transporter permease [Aeromonas salmonicida]TNI73860.1 peptide ABC transporter permease [Aeromonas salmonicida]